MKTLDDDIRDAFAALDGTTPAGYFDTLASRVDQRLEVEAMGPEMMSTRNEGNDRPPQGGDVETRDENSGLHDIKQMATSTKKRISRRHSTQSDAEESLLNSASSASLSAIVLPEPGKDEEHYESEERPAVAVAARSSSSSDKGRTGMPVWIYGAVVAAAAAAGLVFYLTRGGGKDDGARLAAAEQAPETAPVATGAAPPAAPTAAPIEDDPAPAAADDLDSAETDDDPAGEAAATAEGDADGEPAVVAKNDPPAKSTPSRTVARSARKSSSSGSDKGAASKAAKADKPAKAPAKPAADGKRSLDDLLDEAAGGAKSNKDIEADKPAEPKVAAKTELTKSEIQSGMREIRGRVGACHDKFKESGNVMVKVEISPNGSVTSAKATGKFANTETGLCVAQAVEKATFPAWEGKPKRFSYPFLLSQ